MKLAAISMIRDEADIIVPFLRHLAALFDMVFLLDQRSSDGSEEVIRDLVALLDEADPEAGAGQYDKLAAGVDTSFRDDGAENERGETDLVDLIQLHETYHRGQITFQKYVYARTAARPAQAS